MPYAFPGLSVKTDQRFREKVVSETVPAIPIVCGCANRDVNVAELIVGAQDRPGIRVACVLPRLVLPGIDAELAFLRHCMENPGRLSCAHIESLHVTAGHLPVCGSIGY